MDSKTKDIKRDTKRYFIIHKGRIYQDDINIINKYEPNIAATKYKENLGGLQERYRQQHTYTMRF